ncbi:multidrug effflux MFS transporter [Scleromatobacter humisilvae]|uniref:Bcr/CflA family efflux transporter n=1 Tax=Scleromatobacter humisilvae TaxID=2897159 RepID=A0A9X1YKU5_9BURK|nr:multidrug effflux MFS transporter [Scleromatobacter humisilvae]MCK9687806.1 multidrug effflux MFS transporter [Scleromatobacter humisilvae]
MKHNFLRLALVLGLLSAIGPFAIDMYLPALPAIGRALHADVHQVQLSLMTFFLAFALSQLLYGPASDMFGRKTPLYVGIVLFIAGSVGCAFSPSIGWLIAFRFVQGLGGGAPNVITLAVVRDLHTGAEAARLMSLLMLVFSVSPILAPVMGSVVIDAGGWPAIFAVVGTLGVLGLALARFALEETRPAAERAASGFASTGRAFATLLRDPHFLGLAGVVSLGVASFFIYLSNSSFVLINHYGLTPRQYGLAFSVNAASFIGASQLAGRLGHRYGLKRVVSVSVAGFALTMCAGSALNLAGIDHLATLIVMLMIGFGFLGLVIPSTTVMALEHHGAIAGAASALMGTMEMVGGAIFMALMGLVVDGTARPMLAGVAGAAVLTWGMAAITLRSERNAAPTH